MQVRPVKYQKKDIHCKKNIDTICSFYAVLRLPWFCLAADRPVEPLSPSSRQVTTTSLPFHTPLLPTSGIRNQRLVPYLLR